MKIAPQYEGPVVYVKDASRAVGVCQPLVDAENRSRAIIAKIKARPRAASRAACRQEGEGAGADARAGARQPLPHRLARLSRRRCRGSRRAACSTIIRWRAAAATSTGCRSSMPGNSTGKFPDVLTDPVVGEAASNLYADARRMLKQLIAERWLQARARRRACFPPTRSTTTSRSMQTTTREQVLPHRCIPAAAEGQSRRASRTSVLRISSRRSRAARATTSARSRSPRASASNSTSSASSAA